MLVDSHAHLNDRRLYPTADEIISQCKYYDTSYIVCASYDVPSSKMADCLSKKYDMVYATIGVHPHDARLYESQTGQVFEQMAKANPKIVAIGETGLDYHYDLSPRHIQRQVFHEQLQLSCHLQLPVVVHMREALEDTLSILNDYKHSLKYGILIHNYSGSEESLKLFDGLGCYYSFGGTLTFKNNKKGVAAFKACKLDKILLETDCPYLTPEPNRGKINMPYYVQYVAQRGAELLGLEYKEFALKTTKNAKTFFGLK